MKASISTDRFSRYLLLAQCDEVAALHLYEHNTALSEALYGVLQGFEVTLRNAMHSAMLDATCQVDWFDHFGLDQPERESIVAAKEKIARKGKPVTPSRVVAESTFGFWCSLTSKHYAAKLWIPHLHKAFPHKHLGHKVASKRLTSIRLLRNTIAHHECILHRNLAQDYREIIETTSWICPDTAAWIRSTTRFEACYRILFKQEVIPPDPPPAVA